MFDKVLTDHTFEDGSSILVIRRSSKNPQFEVQGRSPTDIILFRTSFRTEKEAVDLFNKHVNTGVINASI